MENEDYVSYDVAKILKEIGYDVPTQTYYDANGSFNQGVFSIENSKRGNNGFCSAPSLYDVQKLLRNKYNLSLEPMSKNDLKWMTDIYLINESKYVDSSDDYATFEESLNDAIKKALDYIKENNLIK